MCGIAGFVLDRPLDDRDVELGRRLVDAVRHRGPDGEGAYVDGDEGVYVGHTRLAIIDTHDRNAQPMRRGNLVLSFNGELYNYRELRRRLEGLGHTFETTGDTEVLLAAWEEWGPAALDRFDGMFAFAILSNDGLHLVRDPFGEKPLYWARGDDGIYFSSEPLGLVTELDLRFEPDEEEVASFLSLGFIPPPKTGYPRLRAVPPATHLLLRPEGARSERKYWEPPVPHEGRGRSEPLRERELDAIRDSLATSLERRLHADVPLGLFLSGGVDSTLVAALAARELGRDVGAYTVAFPDGVDESHRARRIARHLNVEHTVIDSLEDDAWHGGPQALRDFFGVPNDNYSTYAMRQLAEAARPHIKVALSGAGGDELFFGYARTRFLHRRRLTYRWLAPVVNAIGSAADGFTGWSERWRLARNLLTGGEHLQYLAAKNREAMPLLRELPALEPAASGLLRDLPRSLAARARDCDIRVVLPGSYLAALDRGSMAASLEVRTPYLSRDLLTLVSSFDQASLLLGGHKSVPRRILGRYVPSHLVDPGKQGFVLPHERFLATCPPAPPEAVSTPMLRGVADAAWDQRADRWVAFVVLRLSLLAAFMEDAAPRVTARSDVPSSG